MTNLIKKFNINMLRHNLSNHLIDKNREEINAILEAYFIEIEDEINKLKNELYIKNKIISKINLIIKNNDIS